MPFSKEQISRIEAGIDRALSYGSRNEWERQFLMNIRSKFQRYGSATRLSDKQYRKLMQLVDGSRHASNVQSISDRARNASSRPPTRAPYWVRREARWFLRRMLIAVSFVAIVLLVQLFDSRSVGDWMPGHQSARHLQVEAIEVVDGDTIRIGADTPSVRLVGFNTPETYSASCSREAQLGYQATIRLSELLQSANSIILEQVRCACPPLTQGSSRCNYGRSCGILSVDGQDVGDILITEGLAAPYQCGRFGCPPRPGDWCSQ